MSLEQFVYSKATETYEEISIISKRNSLLLQIEIKTISISPATGTPENMF